MQTIAGTEGALIIFQKTNKQQSPLNSFYEPTEPQYWSQICPKLQRLKGQAQGLHQVPCVYVVAVGLVLVSCDS